MYVYTLCVFTYLEMFTDEKLNAASRMNALVQKQHSMFLS